MTTLTLTISGTSYLASYVTGSAKITAQIQNQGDKLDLRLAVKTGTTLPSIGAEIIFKDGSRTIFGGFITKLDPVEYGIGQLITYRVEASDYTYLLVNKSAQTSYANQTLAFIVADLIANSVDAGYGLTHANTATGPTVTTVAFNHISLRQCFEKLAKLTGFIWWVDYAKDVHFIDPTNGLAAPEKITDSSKNVEGIVLTTDISQVRNDIIVQGGTAESTNYQQVLVGDGSAKEWVLVYTVQTMVSVELSISGGAYAAQTVGVDPKDDPTANQFMYSPDRGSIRVGTASTPGASDKVRVTFTYPFPVIAEVQDAASIISMKAIEGGDGLHSYTINDTTIQSQAQAQQRGLKELDQFSQPVLQGVFMTRTGLLQAGSYFLPGQLLTVNLPSWGISIDTAYVVQKVVTTLDESGSAIEYHYEVTFGGRLIGVVDLLIALSTPEEPLDTSGTVQKIKAVSDVVTVAEVITRNSNVRSVNETVTAAESISKTNVTPPFKWGVNGTANKGIWNKSEWG